MSEASTSDLRWLLPLCQLQNDLVTGRSVADATELALQGLLWLHRAAAAAIWLWRADPPLLMVTANLESGHAAPDVVALRQALNEAGREFGAQGPLPPICVCQEPRVAPVSPDLAHTLSPIRLPDGVAGCVLIASAHTEPTPEQLLGHDIILDGLASTVQRDRRYRDVSVQAANALAQAVDAKDHYTHYHSRNVSRMAEIIARRMGLKPEEVMRTKLAGLLHDLGKIGIPDAILNKPGPLDAVETLQMRQHPVMGQKIVNTIEDLRDVADLVRAHHERWDGKGYPDGLAGEGIPLPARIITVADAYDAMTTDRVYRPGMPIDVAAQELLRHRGTQFDPDVIDAFNGYIAERLRDMQADNGQARAA